MVRSGSKVDVWRYARIGLMCAIASVLSYYPEIPMAFFAPWLKLDFSYVPMLLTGFSLGTGAGFIVLVIKNIFRVLATDTMGVGQLADILIGSAMLVPATLFYYKNRSVKGALTGTIIGVVSMMVVGVLANRFILLPFFLGGGFNQYMADNPLTLWIAVAPFNLVKGSVVCAVTFALYKKLSPFMQNGFRR